jgi:tetratricopeptide (TPR) repeat protein
MGDDVMLSVNNNGTESEGTSAEMGIVVRCSEVRMWRVEDGARTGLLEELASLDAEIGKGDVVPGLELGLRFSRVGQLLRIRIGPKFAFGSSDAMVNGRALPGSSTVEYELLVCGHTTAVKQYPNSPVQQCTFNALLRKEAGNRWFGYRDFLKAGHAYSQGSQLTGNFLADWTEPLPENVYKVRTDCLNNLAAAHLSMGEHRKAKDVCVRLLEDNPDNAKALVRAAKASLGLHEFEECELCLDRLAEIHPDAPELAAERERLKSAIHKYKLQEQEMAQRLSKKMFKPQITTPTPTAAPTPTVDTLNREEYDQKTATKLPGNAVESPSFLLIGTSVVVLLLSIGIAYYLSSIGNS